MSEANLPEVVSDRASKYGRNVVVTGALVLVLAFVPGMDPTNATIWGFTFDEGNVGYFWFMALFLLIFYFCQFLLYKRRSVASFNPHFPSKREKSLL